MQVEVKYSKRFYKQYHKLDTKIKTKLLERVRLLSHDEFNPILNNHKLNGEFDGCRSINVSGDIRIIYIKEGLQIILLLQIGTHSQLY
jgi:addiction module RelE/StbE family toxin